MTRVTYLVRAVLCALVGERDGLGLVGTNGWILGFAALATGIR